MSDEQFPLEDMKNRISDILLEPEIRFCGLIDNTGELIVGDMKAGIVPFENDARRKQMFQELAHRVANRTGFDANLGRVKYSSSRREKVVTAVPVSISRRTRTGRPASRASTLPPRAFITRITGPLARFRRRASAEISTRTSGGSTGTGTPSSTTGTGRFGSPFMT